jgi:predicted RND superfamily exporter protein
MRRADLAVMDMRKTREMIVIGCKYHVHRNKYEEELRRFIVRDNVVRAFDGVDYVFNNRVRQKVRQLITFDENIDDVCSHSSPSDLTWLNYASIIKELMGKSILLDENKLSQVTKNNA